MRDFSHTVNVMVKAYLNDTLKHGDCTACAAGTIISSTGITYPKSWFNLLNYKRNPFAPFAPYYTTIEDGFKQIAATGYTIDEIDKIERAFETAPMGNSGDEWMFNGLMAVVDILAEIHGIDLKHKEEAKALFVKP